MTTFWLSTHLAYACRHSGACCTAGWPIPIEHDRAAAVASAIAAGRVEAPPRWHAPAAAAPADVAGVLARRPDGACVFYRPQPQQPGGSRIGGCGIHDHRPASCRHFPYICVIDSRGVHVTLSHFCPTAADLLFDEVDDVKIVDGPPVPVDGAELEGLDARESLPPIDPQSAVASLVSWEAVTNWEQRLVERLAVDRQVPAAPSGAAFEGARAAVASGWSWPEAPEGLREVWTVRVAPSWGRWRRAVGRYLAARAHASWALYLGAGFSDVERMVDLSRTVLQVEACRACLRHDRPLDRATLTEAIRQSDLLLLHYADPFRLTPIS